MARYNNSSQKYICQSLSIMVKMVSDNTYIEDLRDVVKRHSPHVFAEPEVSHYKSVSCVPLPVYVYFQTMANTYEQRTNM